MKPASQVKFILFIICACAAIYGAYLLNRNLAGLLPGKRTASHKAGRITSPMDLSGQLDALRASLKNGVADYEERFDRIFKTKPTATGRKALQKLTAVRRQIAAYIDKPIAPESSKGFRQQLSAWFNKRLADSAPPDVRISEDAQDVFLHLQVDRLHPEGLQVRVENGAVILSGRRYPDTGATQATPAIRYFRSFPAPAGILPRPDKISLSGDQLLIRFAKPSLP